MCGACDLHRHDEFSTFDGFGNAAENAKLAKKKGLTSLGIANHGNMNGVVEHWKACLAEGIKPILGVEAYFQPKFNKKNPKRDSFHLCLFAENLEGYKNLNRIMTIANEEQRYYKPIVDFALLEKYSEGVIATSGCIASFISQTIVKNRPDMAKAAIQKFVDIFGDNFYMEIQPYTIEEREGEGEELMVQKRHYNLQRRVNIALIKLAKKMGIKMIVTSDSHYANEDDYDTYCKMHEIKGSGEYNETYRERFMPENNDLARRFMKMHGKDFKDARKIAKECLEGLQDIEDKVEMDILGQLELELPKLSGDSSSKLWNNLVNGLKREGKTTKEYRKRVKLEYNVMVHHGFEDYFLIVEDYVKYAKRDWDHVDEDTKLFWRKFIDENNYPEDPIKVGPGRGSVCNSLAAYALGITEVDPVYFDIDFRRFLRMDKNKMPDIDLDFETDRRQEVIEYIVARYPGKSAQICSYGMYKVDNCLNDLFKVCGVDDVWVQKQIKEFVKQMMNEEDFDYKKAVRHPNGRQFNKQYDNIIHHFSRLYKKVRFIGTHAAGVAVVGGDLLDYTSIEKRGSESKGYMRTTAYNLNNLDEINVIKFDMLGLRTLSITKELEELTDECFSYEWLEDPEVYEYFKQGKTDGIFQFEKATAKNILIGMEADRIDDVIAASALNRPGPLSLKMPEHYAHNKLSGEFGGELWEEITNKTYGTVVYQEQIQAICRDIGGLSFEDADKVVKFMKSTNMTDAQIRQRKEEFSDLENRFVEGCVSKGMTKQDAFDLFEKITVYSFNQGHSTGYSLVSFEQMYFKVKHPELFWYVTLKYGKKEDMWRLKAQAVHEGNVILIPHINYGARFSIVEIDGDTALAEGLVNINKVGQKAAEAIENERLKNGDFKSKQDFLDRVEKRQVNSGVVNALEENGALLFNEKIYFERVQKYNSTLYMKGMGKQ